MSDQPPSSEPPVTGPAPDATFEQPEFAAGEPTAPSAAPAASPASRSPWRSCSSAGSAAVALYALRGSPDSLGRMAPADSDFYVSVNLDPGLGQKANLSRLASKFPALHGTGEIRKTVHEALDGMVRQIVPGMSFTRDVEPWLGSQVAVVGRRAEPRRGGAHRLEGRSGGGLGPREGHEAVRRALDDRCAHRGHRARRPGSRNGRAYAIVDHAAVVGTSERVVEDVIDADQGTSPRLIDSVAYTKTVASLPGDRLALAFMNYPHLVKALTGSAIDPGLLGPVSGAASLDAYEASAWR